MTRIVVLELIFDFVNIEHIKKHKVTAEEAILAGKHAIYHEHGKKGRYIVVGRVDKRLIAIIVRRKSLKRYYLVTARDARKEERKKVYEKEKTRIA